MPEQPLIKRPAAASERSSAQPQPVARTLGSVLRSLRKQKHWTLKEMSRRTGIPLSTLSKVEHDRLSLTYNKIQQLSERLKIPVAELFSEAMLRKVSPVTARRSIGRVDNALRIHTVRCDHFYLCTDMRDKRMIPAVMRIRARATGELARASQHAGEEYVYVLDGRVEVQTAFYDPLVLEAGQSIYIDSSMDHAYLAADGCEEATILVVCASSEKDLMDTLLESHSPADGRGAAPD